MKKAQTKKPSVKAKAKAKTKLDKIAAVAKKTAQVKQKGVRAITSPKEKVKAKPVQKAIEKVTTPKKAEPDLEKMLGGVQAPSASQLETVALPVNKAIELMNELEQIDELAKAKRAELHQLTAFTIPDAMVAAGVSEFKAMDGTKVTIKEFLNGSLPKDPELKQKALAWLEKNDGADLIKNFVNIEFGKGDKKVSTVQDYLEDLGIPFKHDETVHPMTLAAFARERMKAGADTPLDILGLFAGRAAKIALPKEK